MKTLESSKSDSLQLSQTYLPAIVSVLLIGITLFLTYWPVSADNWAVFSTIFLGIFIEAVPFLLLGTLASGLLEVFVDQDTIRRLTPSSPVLGALIGCFLGLLFPVCECGVVPLVRRLFRKGFPISAGIAFLLAAPVINPIVILSTITAFGFGKMVILRIGITLATAFLTGLVFSTVKTPWEILKPTAWITPDTEDNPDEHHHCAVCEIHKTKSAHKIEAVIQVTLEEFFEIGRYLIIGALLSAGMQTFIPQNTLLSIGNGPVISVLVMICMAVILSICSTVDAFVALGFGATFSTGSILAFLTFGPMVDIKSILLFLRILKPRPVIYLVIIPFLFILLITISTNYFLVI